MPRLIVSLALLLLSVIIVNPDTSSFGADSAISTINLSDSYQSGDVYRIVGYFPHWGIYTNDYTVQQAHTNGSASILTHINYAFANVGYDLRCSEETRAGWGDAYADYGRPFSGEESVDFVADSLDQDLKGHFNQLRKLKLIYPHLKILLSIGGATWSGRFSDAALPEHREEFVRSCIDMFIRGNLPWMNEHAVGGPGSAAGLFDGIDIDWEFPASPGFEGDPRFGIPPNVYRSEDTDNFTGLLAEFRQQLDQVGIETGKEYLLTIAAPALYEQYSKIDLENIHPYLDFINIMTYNMHGAWNSTGPTNFHAPLFSSPNDPTPLQQRNASVDNTVSAYIAAGVPTHKIVVGIPFYGRGWTGVPNRDNGLYQSAPGMRPAPARFTPGQEDYRRLQQLDFPSFRDPITQGFWIFDGNTFWSFDDPVSITAKIDYIQIRGLSGTMVWSLESDNGTLIAAISNALN
jgi:chitinase